MQFRPIQSILHPNASSRPSNHSPKLKLRKKKSTSLLKNKRTHDIPLPIPQLLQRPTLRPSPPQINQPDLPPPHPLPDLLTNHARSLPHPNPDRNINRTITQPRSKCDDLPNPNPLTHLLPSPLLPLLLIPILNQIPWINHNPLRHLIPDSPLIKHPTNPPLPLPPPPSNHNLRSDRHPSIGNIQPHRVQNPLCLRHLPAPQALARQFERAPHFRAAGDARVEERFALGVQTGARPGSRRAGCAGRAG